jgi:hypothetical protein
VRIREIGGLIFAVGVGLVLVRSSLESERFERVNNDQIVVEIGSQFLVGYAVTAAALLIVERVRRPPAADAWGPGRWTIALSGLYVAGSIINFALINRYWWRLTGPKYWGEGLHFELPPLVAALWITLGLARRAKPDRADFREWSGRAFGVTVLTWWSVTVVMHGDP